MSVTDGPRILVTGSRDWTNINTIDLALKKAILYLGPHKDIILVSGACPTGADRIAERLWQGMGRTLELHPAEWDKHKKAAGFIRNAEMVKLGADICLAFIKNKSRGAGMTADLAGKAGISVWKWEE